MNLEFTAKSGVIMYVIVYVHYLNLARGSSIAPPTSWETELKPLGFTSAKPLVSRVVPPVGALVSRSLDTSNILC